MATRQDLRFTRVKLRNWRNFRQVDVRLGERAFIVGPNASGKSNFLDAMRFLRDVAKPEGGLASALKQRDGFSAVRCLHARRPSDVELEMSIGSNAEPELWTYQLRLQQRRNERFATVDTEKAKHRGETVLDRVRRDDERDPLSFSQTALEQVTQNQAFRPLVEFLASVRYMHLVPQIVRDARRHLSETEDPHGGDLLRRINDTPEKTRAPRLRRISEALTTAVPQFKGLSLDHDSDGRPHLRVDFNHWRLNPALQNETQLSDGTLRFIGFLWSIGERGGTLLLEEPELSLHESVVSKLPAMMRRVQRLSGRQIIATTHSPAMIDGPGVALDEVHQVLARAEGSEMLTASEDLEVAAQVKEAGWTIADAIQPRTAPHGVEALARLNLLAR